MFVWELGAFWRAGKGIYKSVIQKISHTEDCLQRKKKVKWGGNGEQISALYLGTLVRSVPSLMCKGETIKKEKRRTVRRPEQTKGEQEY